MLVMTHGLIGRRAGMKSASRRTADEMADRHACQQSASSLVAAWSFRTRWHNPTFHVLSTMLSSAVYLSCVFGEFG